MMSAWRARPQVIFLLLLSTSRASASFVYVSGYLHWPDARAICVARGGDLASISSSSEESAAAAAITGSKHTWIGFTCAASGSCADQSEWAWADGSAVGYTNWVGSEPNGATEDCAVIKSSGGWGNLMCSNAANYVDGYLCSIPPVGAAPAFSWAHKLAWKMRRVAADDFGGGAFFVGNCAWRLTCRSTKHMYIYYSAFRLLLLLSSLNQRNHCFASQSYLLTPLQSLARSRLRCCPPAL